MNQRVLWLCVLVAACDKTPDPNNTGPSGPTTRSCDGIDFTGVVRSEGALNPTEANASCMKDYDCWIGQMCVMNKCTAKSDEKLQGEVTVPAAGNYVVSVFAPADSADEAQPGEIAITFSDFPSRASRVLQLVRRVATVDPADMAALVARTQYEPFLRDLEADILRAYPSGVPPVSRMDSGGPGRQTSCGGNEFGFRGSCVALGSSLAMPIKFFQAKQQTTASVTARVQAIVGHTAVLWDMGNTTTVNQTQIDQLAQKFDTIVGPRVRQFYNKAQGHTGKLDTDGNGKVAIVLSEKAGAQGQAGVFIAGDVLAASVANATGTEMDVLWAQPLGASYTQGATTVTPNEAYALGTLAHEYQHMINFARAQEHTPAKVETRFLDEGLAHLAEDLSGYGASNITTIAQYLADPESSGLLFSIEGTDRDEPHTRGAIYLYLRYLYEQAGGAQTIAGSGSITDKGGIAFLEKIMSGKDTGLTGLAMAGGSSHCRFPLFFPALGISNNASNAPAKQADKRFNFAATATDPLTGQITGVNIGDSSRTNAFGSGNILVGYVPRTCDSTQKASGGCSIFATGGVTFLWESAPTMGSISVKAASSANVRLSLVKVD